jgi:transitional endoplasmic reticulum ATPase
LIFEYLDSLITQETRSYFLNEVDGSESNDGILMIGSINNLSKFDPSLPKRLSRFDHKYQSKLPNEDERTAYCQF